jgi:hypothetical protein
VAVATKALSELASSAATDSSAATAEVQLQNLQLRASALQQQFKDLSGDELQQALAGGQHALHDSCELASCVCRAHSQH